MDGASTDRDAAEPCLSGVVPGQGDFRSGHHEAIVTHELFAAVSAKLEARRTRRPGTSYQIDRPLKGRITCAQAPPIRTTDYAQNYAYPVHRHVVTLHDRRTPGSPQVLLMEQHGQIRLNHYAQV